MAKSCPTSHAGAIGARFIFYVLAIGIVSGAFAVEPTSNRKDPSPYFRKDFTLSQEMSLGITAVERPADFREAKVTGIDLTKYRIIVVSAEIKHRARVRNVGVIAQIIAKTENFEETRRRMATPVFDAVLVDDTVYVLAKSGISTELHELSDAEHYVPGGHSIVADVAVEGFGFGVDNLIKPDDPVLVGSLRGAKILRVKNREVGVELIDDNHEKRVRDIRFLDKPLKIPHVIK